MLTSAKHFVAAGGTKYGTGNFINDGRLGVEVAVEKGVRKL